jgi:uncharacterized protein DUF6636
VILARRSRTAIGGLICLAVVVLLVSTVSPARAARHGRKFRMPSGNITCSFHSDVLRCDIRSGLKPEPKRKCELDWTGLYLEARGKAGPQCAGDTNYDPDAPVLDYGAKWKRHGAVCRSRTSGLRCHNRKGHGFFLSRDSWDTF